MFLSKKDFEKALIQRFSKGEEGSSGGGKQFQGRGPVEKKSDISYYIVFFPNVSESNTNKCLRTDL